MPLVGRFTPAASQLAPLLDAWMLAVEMAEAASGSAVSWVSGSKKENIWAPSPAMVILLGAPTNYGNGGTSWLWTNPHLALVMTTTANGQWLSGRMANDGVLPVGRVINQY